MNIQITSRHSKASNQVQEYLKNELKDLEKYCDKITSCHVILDSEHILKTVEIIIYIQGNTVKANAKTENLGKSVDEAMQKIVRQLKKFNKKKKNHKGGKVNKIDLNNRAVH